MTAKPPEPDTQGWRVPRGQLATAIVLLIVAGFTIGLVQTGHHSAHAAHSAGPASSTAVAGGAKRYKLTATDQVGGEYWRAKVVEKPLTGTAASTLAGIGVTDPSDVIDGMYRNNNGRELLVQGMWGQIGDPARTVDWFVAQATAKSGPKGFTAVGEAQPLTPAGLGDAVMKCLYLTPPGAATGRIPACVWSDHSTVGLVMTVDNALDLRQAADITVRVRDSTVTAIG